MEQVTIITFLLLAIGVVWPIVALVFGGIQFVSRIIYVWGYKKGPKMRAIGGIPLNLSILGMCGTAVAACSVWIHQTPW